MGMPIYWSPVKSVKLPTVAPPIVSVSIASAIRDSSRSIARRACRVRAFPERWERSVRPARRRAKRDVSWQARRASHSFH